jgi:hypothetical protein
VNWWEKVGAVAAVAAAIAGFLSWRVGVRANRAATASRRYERLAEARRLVADIRLMADNTYWDRCREAQAQLRSVLKVLRQDLPETRALAETEWNQETYSGTNDHPALQSQVAAARAELEAATARIG